MESAKPSANESIFSEDLHEIIRYEPATKGQRVLNYFIDNLLMNYGLSYVTGTIVGYILAFIAPEWILTIPVNDLNMDLLLLSYIVAVFNYIIYYTICEKAFRGYTLGKFITGTKAIREDGSELTMRDAFLRSISRLVPLEPLSGLGDAPWHDSWTKTTVIKTR